MASELRDLVHSVACLAKALYYLVFNARSLVVPFKWEIFIASLASLLLYVPVRRYLVAYQLGILRLLFGRLLTTGNYSARILTWTQTHVFTSILLRPFRRKWWTGIKKAIAEIHQSKTNNFRPNFEPSAPAAASDLTDYHHHQKLSREFKYLWFKCRASGYWTRLFLFFFSTPINCVPYCGPLLYLWMHSGIKARVAAKRFANTEPGWNKIQRAQWILRNWSRLRLLCLIKIIVAILPFLGIVLTMVVDSAILIWMSDEKIRISTAKI